MGDPHRVGVVGLGVISRAYLDTLADHPEVSIIAVADLDAARSAAVAATIPGAEALSVERLLARPDVQTVLNLTIPAAHADISLGAIDAGKHVYVEKPLAVTFADGRSIIERAASAGVRVGCAPDTVLGTGTQTARAAIDAGLDRTPDVRVGRHGHPRARALAPQPRLLLRPGRRPAAGHGAVLHLGADPPARAGSRGDRSRQPAARRARHRLGPAHRPADPGGGGHPRDRRARARQRCALHHHDELRRRHDDGRADRGARGGRHARRARSELLRRRGPPLRARRHRVARSRTAGRLRRGFPGDRSDRPGQGRRSASAARWRRLSRCTSSKR